MSRPRTPDLKPPADGNTLDAARGRLREAKHFWQQALSAYDDSEAFRINVNACVQALRNVTWLLQSDKDRVSGFDSWYANWRKVLDSDPTLRWLVKARNRIVKQADLQTESKARVSLIIGYNQPPILEFYVSPRLTAQTIARRLRESEDTPELARRRGLIAVERRWVDVGLPGRELLDALAHCYRVLSHLVEEAHALAGVALSDVNGGDMFAARRDRLIILELSSGARLKVDSQVAEYSDRFFAGEVTDLQKRYRTKFKPAPAKPILESGSYWLEYAKKIMRVDGAHKTFVFYFVDSMPGSKPPVHMIELNWDDHQGKYVAWRHVADEAVELGATAVMMIGELWAVAAKDWVNEVAIDDQPRRTEYLTVCVATRNGLTKSWSAPIVRSEAGVGFGKTLVEDSAPVSMQPLLTEWQIRARESGRRTDTNYRK